MSDVPGWHGKLPTVSDFAGRRLDARFVELWDDAVSDSLAALREANGENWAEAYLACPTWRFLVGRGVLCPPFDATAWGGILMPSVDRVGRYYPLLLACPILLQRGHTAAAQALWEWLDALEELAVSALHDDWTIDQLEDSLAELQPPATLDDGTPAFADGEADELLPGSPAAVSAFFDVGVASSGTCTWYSRNEKGAERVLTSMGPRDGVARIWTANLAQAPTTPADTSSTSIPEVGSEASAAPCDSSPKATCLETAEAHSYSGPSGSPPTSHESH
jgi:type VI secretion system protein ImpM